VCVWEAQIRSGVAAFPAARLVAMAARVGREMLLVAGAAGAAFGAAGALAWLGAPPRDAGEGGPLRLTRHAGIAAGLLDCVGGTPLVELRSLSRATGCRILVRAPGFCAVGPTPVLIVVTHAPAVGRPRPNT
jgi:hypothetical protein